MKSDVIDYLKSALEVPDEEIEDFLTDFFTSLDECCTKLRGEIAEPNFSNIRVVTHTLIGFCENLGAVDMADRARALNAAAKIPNAALCVERIHSIFELQKMYHNS